jgi:dTDP-glucose pyrophosphorylase
MRKGIILAGGSRTRLYILPPWPSRNNCCPPTLLGWINAEQMKKLAKLLAKNNYGQYFLGIINEKVFR